MIGDMRTLAILAAVAAVGVGALDEGNEGQIVIGGGHASAKEGRKLSGRFLHITGPYTSLHHRLYRRCRHHQKKNLS